MSTTYDHEISTCADNLRAEVDAEQKRVAVAIDHALERDIAELRRNAAAALRAEEQRLRSDMETQLAEFTAALSAQRAAAVRMSEQAGDAADRKELQVGDGAGSRANAVGATVDPGVATSRPSCLRARGPRNV